MVQRAINKMNKERIEKLLSNSIVKLRYLKADLEKISKEIEFNQRGGKDENGFKEKEE